MFEKFDQAIAFAAAAHAGQVRKIANTPYILHPMEVASIIATMTNDEDVLIAGLLHDTIEDCNADPEEIRTKFGKRAAALVQSETEDKLSDRPPAETWMARKEESLLMLQHTKDRDVKILWLADKLSNIRSFHREYMKSGDALWQHLNQKDSSKQAWYYRSVIDCVSELSDTDAYREFCRLVGDIFGT